MNAQSYTCDGHSRAFAVLAHHPEMISCDELIKVTITGVLHDLIAQPAGTWAGKPVL